MSISPVHPDVIAQFEEHFAVLSKRTRESNGKESEPFTVEELKDILDLAPENPVPDETIERWGEWLREQDPETQDFASLLSNSWFDFRHPPSEISYSYATTSRADEGPQSVRGKEKEEEEKEEEEEEEEDPMQSSIASIKKWVEDLSLNNPTHDGELLVPPDFDHPKNQPLPPSSRASIISDRPARTSGGQASRENAKE